MRCWSVCAWQSPPVPAAIRCALAQVEHPGADFVSPSEGALGSGRDFDLGVNVGSVPCPLWLPAQQPRQVPAALTPWGTGECSGGPMTLMCVISRPESGAPTPRCPLSPARGAQHHGVSYWVEPITLCQAAAASLRESVKVTKERGRSVCQA